MTSPIGGVSSYATGINNLGQVVGFGTTLTGQTHAILWSNGQIHDLGTLGGTYSYARAINDSGQIVGGAYTTGNAALRATQWIDGHILTLTDFGGRSSEAYSINSSGSIAGYSDSYSGATGVLWTDGKPSQLQSLTGTPWRLFGANGINEAGEVVGSAYLPSKGAPHAVSWAQGIGTDLGTLGGSSSNAFAVNDAGEIVGVSDIAVGSSAQHATVWRNGVAHDLGTLGGYYSDARDINNSGQIVGLTYSPTTDRDGSLAYISDGLSMTDLNTLISNVDNPFRSLYMASGINERGQIVGTGTTVNGQYHAFLLTPVEIPEPSSILTFLLGLAIFYSRLLLRNRA